MSYQSNSVRHAGERLILPCYVQPTDFSSWSSWLNAFSMMMLLLLFCHPVYAEEPKAPPRPKLTVENINKTTEVLRDPTVITEKIGQGLEGFRLPTDKNAPPAPPGSSGNKGELKDPTLMNQNFRDALNRATQNKTGTVTNVPGAGSAPAVPVLPKISLLASVWGGQKNKSSAMLRINDRTEMVYAGDKITFFDKNEVIDIQVLDIHKHYVKIRVLPANETIILR
jgi:hypothetical protein